MDPFFEALGVVFLALMVLGLVCSIFVACESFWSKLKNYRAAVKLQEALDQERARSATLVQENYVLRAHAAALVEHIEALKAQAPYRGAQPRAN